MTHIGAIVIGLSIGLLVAIILWRNRIHVHPAFTVKPGAFSDLASSRLCNPQNLLHALREFVPPNGAPSSVQMSAPLSGRQVKRKPPSQKSADWMATALDSAMPGLHVWSRWHSVDSEIFQAFSHLSHEQIGGVGDLIRVVDAKSYAIGHAGFVNKIAGHVGEWHVHKHLDEAGASVAIPYKSNERGLDIWANDHALNVKTVSDASSAASGHFADFPDIPIVVPFDAARIPSDALHFDPSQQFSSSIFSGDHVTIVDDALSRNDVFAQTENALEVAGDPGAHWNFPWITAAVSGFRETRLLIKGHTDVSRAVKNTAIDTGAVGGGGALGLKTGAAIGALVGPIGMAIGGAIGALVGGIGGRAVASSLKQAPLVKAESTFHAACNAYQTKEAELVRFASYEWATAHSDAREELRNYSEEVEKDYHSRLAVLRKQLADTLVLRRDDAAASLDKTWTHICEMLQKERKRVRERIPRWLPLWAAELHTSKDARILFQHYKEARLWRKQADALLTDWDHGPSSTSRCLDLVMIFPEGRVAAEEFLYSTVSRRCEVVTKAGRLYQLAIERVATKRETTVQRLKSRWVAIQSKSETAIAPFIDALKKASEDYRSELRKAGIGD